jgi:hypothetical protein
VTGAFFFRGKPGEFFEERGRRLEKQLVCLIELQKTESAAGRIHAKKRSLPVQVNKLEEDFKAFCEVVETEREQMESLRKRRRERTPSCRRGSRA